MRFTANSQVAKSHDRGRSHSTRRGIEAVSRRLAQPSLEPVFEPNSFAEPSLLLGPYKVNYRRSRSRQYSRWILRRCLMNSILGSILEKDDIIVSWFRGQAPVVLGTNCYLCLRSGQFGSWLPEWNTDPNTVLENWRCSRFSASLTQGKSSNTSLRMIE